MFYWFLFQLLTNGPQHYLFLQALKRKIQFKSINKKFNKDITINEDKPSQVKKQKIEESKPQNDINDDEVDFRNSYILKMSQQLNIDDSVQTLNESQVIFEPFSQVNL